MSSHVAILLTAAVLLITPYSLKAVTNMTDTSDCVFAGIDANLATTSQIIENVRKKLPKSVNDLCAKVSPIIKPLDCSDLYKQGHYKDGPYEIWPRSRVSKGSLRVFCDMTGHGGGWTVLQRRGNFGAEKEYFYQDWDAYKNGFGNILKDFWIGNDNMFALTNQRAYELRFDFADWEESSAYATYDEFWIDDELHSYVLHVKGFRGTAGDSFSKHSGAKFSTKDKDNDIHETVSCAVNHKGAWWYTNCHASNLNAVYYEGKHDSYADGVNWYSFKGHHYSLKDAVMKIRPTGFETNINVEKTTV